MRQKRILRSWEEQDAFTTWRRYMFWQRGELRKAKRRLSKRERRSKRQDIDEQREDHE